MRQRPCERGPFGAREWRPTRGRFGRPAARADLGSGRDSRLERCRTYVATAAGRRKERNVCRDGRVSLTVYDPADPLRYVEVRGTATVTEDVGR
ncbi:pyridoxamine 5'-phosphate oxidase family protein [Streptomyces sp. NPDC052107]|uniref:pyridoxamine 5'-phosphate oxidase family protein n=1 Tax=Streptomyces sp. NPDC052107 TaxID=3155632 RepID=UPI00342EB202